MLICEIRTLNYTNCMKKLRRIAITLLPVFLFASCETFSFSKERAAEKRKQDLCQEIETKDLPHCSGSLENE